MIIPQYNKIQIIENIIWKKIEKADLHQFRSSLSLISSSLTKREKVVVICMNQIYRTLKSNSIRTPTVQIHNFLHSLLSFPHLFQPQLIWNSSSWSRRWRRWKERKRSDIVLGMLMQWPNGVIPPANALVFQCLNCSNCGCHNPGFACWNCSTAHS